jgi:hypothetical protein
MVVEKYSDKSRKSALLLIYLFVRDVSAINVMGRSHRAANFGPKPPRILESHECAAVLCMEWRHTWSLSPIIAKKQA